MKDFLDILREESVKRCESPKGFNHTLESWSYAEWTNAICGEAGEAANLGKKLIRFRDNVRGNGNLKFGELLDKMADEIADAVIYGDLTLAKAGISLKERIIKRSTRNTGNNSTGNANRTSSAYS